MKEGGGEGGPNIHGTISPWKEGYHTYSLRMGGILCVLYLKEQVSSVGIGCLAFLRSRCKNAHPPSPCDLPMFIFMMMFTLCFRMGKAHGWQLGLRTLTPHPPTPLSPRDLPMLRFMMTFTLCFRMGKTHWWEKFSK